MDFIWSLIAPLWSNWLLVALMAPALNALVNLLDVYLTERVYEDEYDGVTISAVFQLLIWVLIPFIKPSFEIDGKMILLAILSGALFVASSFFYFKAMCLKNDAVIIESIWGLTLIFVPIFSLIMVGKKLSMLQYAGILVAFLGVVLPSLNTAIKDDFWKVFKLMLGAIIFLSLSMALEEKIYSEVCFLDGYLFFSLGSGLAGSLFVVIRKIKTGRGISSFLMLSKDNIFTFFLAESMALLAITCSNRAVDLASSASLVAVAECCQEMFIVLFSVVMIAVCRRNTGYYYLQITAWNIKFVSFALIGAGVYMVS